jgi:hypothetical protein
MTNRHRGWSLKSGAQMVLPADAPSVPNHGRIDPPLFALYGIGDRSIVKLSRIELEVDHER